MTIEHSVEVKTNASKAWEVVGPNFLNIADWGVGINKSWENDSIETRFDEAPVGGRFCDIAGFGTFDERIIHYDSTKHEISWSASGENLPKFISGLQNALKVEIIDDNTCQVSSNITAKLNGVGGFF